MQRQSIHAFTEFQRAAERQDLLTVIGCGDDLMEVVREFQKEAYFMAACILHKVSSEGNNAHCQAGSTMPAPAPLGNPGIVSQEVRFIVACHPER